jgi:6-phosphofructokinase
MPRKSRCIGILTAGGDCPGLNAAIRAVTKTAVSEYGMKVIGILDGFRGLVENRTVPLDDSTVSGILTRGGTILGTSRDKPHKMLMGGKYFDMTETAVENARKLQIDCLVCLGGGGTQKNALRLHQKGGIDVITLPKTIDNDIPGTDITFGFDTARSIATEAIDRLHTTATSHHRIIVCELMGHRAGWLALAAGISGGADAILIPEIPYDLNVVGDYVVERRRSGKRFSIIAVAEGARSKEEVAASLKATALRGRRTRANRAPARKGSSPDDLLEEGPGRYSASDETREGLPLAIRKVADEVMAYHVVQEPMASRIARQIQERTGVEARVTSLGHVQRGGVPTAFDRMLCTLLGTKAAELLNRGVCNVMVAYREGKAEPVPLEKVVGHVRMVPRDHPWIHAARLVGSCFGDE